MFCVLRHVTPRHAPRNGRESSFLASIHPCPLQPYYMPTVNNPDMSAFALTTAGELFGPEAAQTAEPLMTGARV
jgi:hypothetical protein